MGEMIAFPARGGTGFHVATKLSASEARAAGVTSFTAYRGARIFAVKAAERNAKRAEAQDPSLTLMLQILAALEPRAQVAVRKSIEEMAAAGDPDSMCLLDIARHLPNVYFIREADGKQFAGSGEAL